MLFCQVLASEVNIGYEDIVNTQVRQVNGKAVRNLSDLTKQIESCKDEYLKFDLEYDQVGFFSWNLQQPSASGVCMLLACFGPACSGALTCIWLKMYCLLPHHLSAQGPLMLKATAPPLTRMPRRSGGASAPLLCNLLAGSRHASTSLPQPSSYIGRDCVLTVTAWFFLL